MFGYAARLKGDLARWRAEGRISAEQEASLYADALANQRGVPITAIVGLLGALLLSLAVVTFVSANWDGLSRLQRLVVLFGGLWAAYGVSWALFLKNHDVFAEMALLVANAIFGAGIALIAQTYHLSGYTPDAVMLWMGGVFVAAALARSTPSLVLAVGLLAVWILADAFDRSNVPAWQVGVAWAIGLGLALRQNSLVAMHALCLAGIAWMLAIGVETRGQFWPFALVGLAAVAIGLWGGRLAPEPLRRMLPALVVYGAVVAIGAVFLHQVEFWGYGAARHALPPQLLSGAAVLGGSLAAIVKGAIDRRRGLMAVGFIGFGAELLYIYAETFGSLLSTAAFYLVAGLMLIALSYGFMRLGRRRGSHGIPA